MTTGVSDWLTSWLIDYLTDWLLDLSISFVGHLFPIARSKSAPQPRCFVHFDLQMRFAPQRRANFPDRNIQRCFVHFDLQMSFATAAWQFPDRNIQYWSRAEVFCTFWLTNVLRATAACHFSCLCWTATSAPAALASLVFEHQEPRIIEKTQRFATFLTFGAWVSSF